MPQVTAAEISRMAGVSRATVSNWRRRHADFPSPSGGTETSPAYDLDAVRSWLSGRGQLPAETPAEDLRAALRERPERADPTRLLPLVLAAHRLDPGHLDRVLELPDEDLIRRATDLVGDAATYGGDEAPVLRTLLRCVRVDGALVAADILAERGTDDSTTTGTYRTPAEVADLMADLLLSRDRRFPSDVYDPACGIGGLLAAAARHGARRLYGQDLLPAQAVQAATRLGLQHRNAKADIRSGDSLRDDAFPSLGAGAILCNPPYGNRDWGQEVLAYDPRWVYGLPPKGEPELAWVQHCLAHLAPGGRAVLLMPPATAERTSGRRIRAELVKSGALRAVMALPAGAAPPPHIGLNLWVLTRTEDESQAAPDTVLFVDAVGPGRQGWESVREAVLSAWSAYEEGVFEAVPSVARAVPVVDLLAGPTDLTPARHVQSVTTAIRPADHMRQVRRKRTELRQAADRLLSATEPGERWTASGKQPQTWRTTAVADLLRGGALTLLRAVPAGRAPTVDSDVEVRAGDVILPELFARPYRARVADSADEGRPLGRQHLLLRPDPQRLDPWFLAGFLSAEENVNAAATGSTIVRVDVRRLQVPVMALPDQQRYGRAFRQVQELREAADAVSRLAEEAADAFGIGLSGGALLPPDEEQP
ncbi:N-6 DNA methylase [Micromonospora costi]|uniref:SAM-dependent methyltransferase n=1 Tax=Micromonospora costi TaxID=1530042 RepID=A0A3A9ZPA9_9ACTN|nr:N-6 DNA methylase [Micromonospora costi]RKN50118.1 SAM-dependent methyltransferase [Micromonospora costi]